MHIVKIDYKTCTVCGICVETCPMDVFRIEDKTLITPYVGDCQACFLCEIDCPFKALTVVPGRDQD